MFLEWIKVFKDKNLMNGIVEDYNRMIDANYWMFHTIGTCLVENSDPEAHAAELVDRAKQQD